MNTIELALAALNSDSPHQRLKAARFLKKAGGPSEVPALKAALHRETVSWVRRALVTALDTHERPIPKPVDTDEKEATSREIRTEVVNEVTRTLLHEFEPIIGTLKLHAQQELASYETSKVKSDLEKLEGLVEALQNLRRASDSPSITQFELALFIRDVIAEQPQSDGRVSCIGPDPLVVESDPNLLRLALANGIRNALEATMPLGIGEVHPVTVTWGATDVDVWIAVLDNGPGLPGTVQGAFEIGTTTKPGHSGMGLSIAKQAMDSLDGEISLSPIISSGVRFEIRWYKGGLSEAAVRGR